MGLESGTGAPGNAADMMYARFPALTDLRRRTAGVLSGGQQQQLAIARALIRQPRVLLLDEPTEGIQPSIVEDIARAIQDLRRQGEIAVLVVEQYVDFVLAVADSYHVMQRGTIVAHGPIAHLTDAVVHEHLTV
jgi:urea transport system ATP-binding protein